MTEGTPRIANDGGYFHVPIALAAAAFLYDTVDLTSFYQLYRTAQVAKGVLEDPAPSFAAIGCGILAKRFAGKALEKPAWVVFVLTRAMETLHARRKAAQAFERIIDTIVDPMVCDTITFPGGDLPIRIDFGGSWLKSHLSRSKLECLNISIAPWIQKVISVVAAVFAYFAHMLTLTMSYVGLIDAFANKGYVQEEMTPLLFYNLLQLHKQGPDELKLVLYDAEELLEKFGVYWNLDWVAYTIDDAGTAVDALAEVASDAAATLTEPIRVVAALGRQILSLFFDNPSPSHEVTL